MNLAIETDYYRCRELFQEAAEKAGLRTFTVRVPFENQPELFIDFALAQRNSEKALVSLSGTHGIEGYAGSAIQRDVLSTLPEDGPSLLFVHAVNPYGMALYRRANGNNVDLNRSYNLGPVENPDYVFFDSYLNPKSEFEFFSGLLRAFFSRIRLGEERARQAIAAGQMQAPYGLFFTGKEMQRELRLIQDIIKTHLASTKDLIVMDLHTGLGDFCGEMLFVDHDREEDSPAYFERIFGRPCNIPSPSAGSYSIHGRISDMFRHSLPHVKVRYCLQEFGTHSAGRVIGALRRENFEWRFRQAGIPPSTKVKELMLEAFLPKSPAWRENMLKLGKQRWSQAWRSLHQPSSN